MKTILLFLVMGFFAFFSNSSAQTTLNDSEYLKKIKKYNAMKITGYSLGAIGSLATIVGFNALSSSSYNATLESYFVSFAGIVLGIPLIVSGAVFAIIGTYKRAYYRDKLNGVSINFNVTSYQKGLSLSIKF